MKTNNINNSINTNEITITAERSMRLTDLIGRRRKKADGTVTFEEGPILAAAREGKRVFIENSHNLTRKVSQMLEPIEYGYPIVTGENGIEPIVPERGFELVKL